MKIDRKKLIDMLVEKTGMEKKEVEEQMDQLIERILDAAGRGKALEIKEFGLFYFDQNNDLKFEPSEELTTEISFKYAGMKPVELKPERSTEIPTEVETVEPSDSESNIRVLNKAESKADSTPTAKSQETKKNTEATPSPKSTSPGYKKPAPRKKDNSIVWGILAFLLVLIIGALYIFLQPDETDLTGVAETPTTDQQRTPSEQPSDLTESEMTQPGEPDDVATILDDEVSFEPGQEQTSPATVTTTTPDQPLHGLNGEWNHTINDLYSIVVHSFYNEVRANQVASSLENDGYRASVTARVVNGLDVWRVSIGQFSSIAEAQNHAANLPSPYNNQHFIQRIQQ